MLNYYAVRMWNPTVETRRRPRTSSNWSILMRNRLQIGVENSTPKYSLAGVIDGANEAARGG